MANRKLPVNKNEEISLQIDAMGSEGQGIGRVDGYALFVPGALIGEHVRTHIIKANSGYGVGKLIDIHMPSPDRVEPPCARNGKCGGCALQHMEYGAQLRYKERVVLDALTRIGGAKHIEVKPILAMEHPFQYRNKASFPLANSDGRVELGFFAPRSHRIIETSDCILQREEVLLGALAVRDWANECSISAYEEQTRSGLLRHVVVRVSSLNELMITVVAAGELPHKEELLQALTDKLPSLTSVYLNINRDDTNVILGDAFRLLWGKAHIIEQINGLQFQVGPASFLQVNHLQAERLYACAMNLLALNGGERVIDAYCGMGAITLQIAQSAREVVGIENVPQAIEDAKRNAQLNDIKNARFICDDAEHALPTLAREGFDTLLLDPPRKGAEAGFIDALNASDIRRVVYISCNPATLARDCKSLLEGGYEIECVQPVDMFPQTTHVETVVLLSKLKSTTSIEVKIDLDEIDLSKAESKATYDEIKQYVLDKYGFKVSQLYIAQVKRKHGIIERDNYNVGDGKAKVSQVPADEEKAIEDALRHFKMI